MKADADCCAVHSMTMEKIDLLGSDMKELTGRVTSVETKVATMVERVDNTKALVWLVIVNIIAAVIGIITSAVK